MHTLNRLTSITPLPPLFHYTTQAGLLGILETHSLWATKIHYLNDSSEYIAALTLATEHLKGLLQVETDQRRQKPTEDLMSSISRITGLNICVVSFSTKGDLLSQWRAYGGDTGGYSLEFHTSYLREKAAENDLGVATLGRRLTHAE